MRVRLYCCCCCCSYFSYSIYNVTKLVHFAQPTQTHIKNAQYSNMAKAYVMVCAEAVKPKVFTLFSYFSTDGCATFDLSYVFDTKSIRFSFFSRFMHRTFRFTFSPTINAFLHKSANKSKLPAQ